MRFIAFSLMVVCAAMAGCHAPYKNNLPPAQALMHPGPGVDGPGPGVMMPPTAMQAPNMSSQIAFVGPEGTSISWDVTAPGAFDSEPLTCPARYNFPQGAIYRLKMTNIPGRAGVELYPTLEVGPVVPRTEAFLAHNPIPVEFGPEDFDQVLSGNFVTKVIYLPDPEFQELALAGVGTLVSTRLDPGVDPIVEADRRGAILAIVRLGNIDLQAPGGHTPEAGVASASYQSPNGCPQMPGGGMLPGTAGMAAPQYGMPMSGTPIGLVGPPSVPLGVPAGLQKHTIVNHTRVHLPKPTESVRLDVKQKPGMSYPKPAHHARIVERTTSGLGAYRQPLSDRRECVRPDCPTENCPVEGGTEDAGQSEGDCPQN